MSDMGNGGDVKALASLAVFGLLFGGLGVVVAVRVELFWAAFALSIVHALAGVAVGVLVADRRGWL